MHFCDVLCIFLLRDARILTLQMIYIYRISDTENKNIFYETTFDMIYMYTIQFLLGLHRDISFI